MFAEVYYAEISNATTIPFCDLLPVTKYPGGSEAGRYVHLRLHSQTGVITHAS